MNPDPTYQRWREIAWRRPLTEAEQTELRAYLLAHPELQLEAELDEKLNHILAEAAPQVSSNFTARVWQEIEREPRPDKTARPVGGAWGWRKFLPRFAAVIVLVVGGLVLYRQQVVTRQNELAQAARQVAQVEDWSATVWLADFETIASLSPVAAVADEELLAFSDDLLALTP